MSEQDVATKTDYAGQFFRSVADELDDTWYPDLEKLDDPTTGGRKAFTSKLLELTGLIAWSYVGAQILSRKLRRGIRNELGECRTFGACRSASRLG